MSIKTRAKSLVGRLFMLRVSLINPAGLMVCLWSVQAHFDAVLAPVEYNEPLKPFKFHLVN